MITRSNRSDGLDQSTLTSDLDGDTRDVTATHASSPLSEAKRSAGTVALLGAVSNARGAPWAGLLNAEGGSSARRAVGPGEDGVSVTSLEQKIRSNPAYRSLSAGDRGVAEWIIWQASQRDPQKRAYYLAKLDTLFSTPYVAQQRPGKSELEQIHTARVDAALAREEARGDVFKGQEEQASANARLSPRVGFNGTRYLVDSRDPRSVVVKVKVHLTGPPEFVAKIKQLEDGIEKAASTTGYTVDLEFVDKRGQTSLP